MPLSIFSSETIKVNEESSIHSLTEQVEGLSLDNQLQKIKNISQEIRPIISAALVHKNSNLFFSIFKPNSHIIHNAKAFISRALWTPDNKYIIVLLSNKKIRIWCAKNYSHNDIIVKHCYIQNIMCESTSKYIKVEFQQSNSNFSTHILSIETNTWHLELNDNLTWLPTRQVFINKFRSNHVDSNYEQCARTFSSYLISQCQNYVFALDSYGSLYVINRKTMQSNVMKNNFALYKLFTSDSYANEHILVQSHCGNYLLLIGMDNGTIELFDIRYITGKFDALLALLILKLQSKTTLCSNYYQLDSNWFTLYKNLQEDQKSSVDNYFGIIESTE